MMNTFPNTAAASRYRQTEVLTASGVQLVVLLYDSAIQAIELASDGIARASSVRQGSVSRTSCWDCR